MEQKEKLIELIDDFIDTVDVKHWYSEELDEHLADYLLADGWIRLPCKVGDTVFCVHYVCDKNANEYLDISVGDVISYSMQSEGLWMYCRYENGLTYWHFVTDDFGKTVFTSRAEAEAEIERRRNNV